MVVSFADDVDLDDKKRLYSWSLSQGTGAQIVNFRRGTVTGEIVFQVQVATGTSQHASYAKPLYVPEGWFIEVTATGLNRGFVDVG
jgi:hypothetical protein